MTSRQRLLLLGAGLLIAAIAVSRGVITGEIVLFFVALIPSVILHEVSHGVAALWFGDDTAKQAGRLTLNPGPHVDPFGTLLLPAMLALSGVGIFGYAKPVPVNPRRLRHPRNHGLVVSLVGPFTNVAIAVAAALALRSLQPSGFTGQVLFTVGYVNVILAAFNLIPLPPLDGSAVIERFLPARYWGGYLRLRQYSMVILLAVVLLVPGFLAGVFDPAVRLWARLL